MLGYGQSDKPRDPQEYSLKRISSDLASILDVIRVRKAVSLDRVESVEPWVVNLIGFKDRDWTRLGVAYRGKICPVAPRESPRGSTVSGWFFRWVLGLTPGSVSLGYFPPSSNYERLEAFVKKFPIYKYQLYFASPACIVELDRNVHIVLIFETVHNDLLTPVNSAGHEFLQIFIPFERIFGSRWYPRELW